VPLGVATVGFAAPRLGRDGAWANTQIVSARRAALLLPSAGLAGVAGAGHRVQASSHFPARCDHLKVVMIMASDRRLRIGTPQRVRSCRRRPICRNLQRAVRDQAMVFVMYSFSGERGVYIIARCGCRAQLPRGDAGGTLIVLVLLCALNAAFLHTAPIEQLAGQLMCPAFRQLHFRRARRPHRRRDDLLWPDLLDQRHDVDRAARHDDDGARISRMRGECIKSRSD